MSDDVLTVGATALLGVSAWLAGHGVRVVLTRLGRDAAARWVGFVSGLLAVIVLGAVIVELPALLGITGVAPGGYPWTTLIRVAVLAAIGGIVVRRTAVVLEERLAAGGMAWRSVIVGKAVSYGGAVLLVLLAAETLGLDVSALLATAGVVGVAVGFAAQTSLSNVIAGVFLLLDRPFTVGDVVEIDGQQGVVHRITTMSTLIRTFDNLVVRWPNEVVLKARIVNYAALPVRRIEVAVRVPVDTPLPPLTGALRDALASVPDSLLEPAPEVRLRDLADNGVTILARVWVPRTAFLAGRDAAVLAIQQALLAHGAPPVVPQYEVKVAGPHPGARG